MMKNIRDRLNEFGRDEKFQDNSKLSLEILIQTKILTEKVFPKEEDASDEDNDDA